MHGEQLTETVALETLLAARFPWLPEKELHRASESLAERMAKFDVDNSHEFTPQLMKDAMDFGHTLAADFVRAAPTWGTPPSYRGLLQRLATDALHRVGIGREVGR
jgi:hypothetical protein